MVFFPEITSKSFCGGGGCVKLLLNGMFWPPPPGGKGLNGFVPFSIKSSILGKEGRGPNDTKLFTFVPPPGSTLLSLFLFIKFVPVVPLSLSNLFLS